jgi:DNA-binding NtrC family response regulator
MTARILVVDDEVGMQIALREVLQRQNHIVTIAGDGMAALNYLETQTFDLVLSDVRMPEVTGIELLERVRTRRPELPVVIMTAFGTIEDAVEAMKKGASDYLLKPFSSEAIESVVNGILRQRGEKRPEEDSTEVSDEAIEVSSANPIAISPRMREILDVAREVADSVATVLIQGESGTGKEVLARYIHHYSGRTDRSFVAINCAALPEGLLESELFGHEKGAFTGAVIARKGKFELANRGTLLLDEVSEMPLVLQAKLLRALQEREVDPIGAQRPVPLDVRVIATTNRDLASYVNEGNFREDLFYRLQVIAIEIPPLRERYEDILPLAEYFLRRHCRMNRRPRKRLSVAMKDYMVEQDWPGNVRQLENFIERAVLLCREEEIRPDNVHMFSSVAAPMMLPRNDRLEVSTAMGGGETYSGETLEDRAGPVLSYPQDHVTLEEMEKRMILQTLQKVGGNRTRAADMLGVSVRTIRNKLNQYGDSTKIMVGNPSLP